MAAIKGSTAAAQRAKLRRILAEVESLRKSGAGRPQRCGTRVVVSAETLAFLIECYTQVPSMLRGLGDDFDTLTSALKDVAVAFERGDFS